ncbi:MAG: prephenate dehydratase domain-containing protein [Patescibacteria group bacterium]
MIALLGPRLTHSDYALDTVRSFRDMPRRYCRSITSACRAVRYRKARYGIVPISNSYTGEIMETAKAMKMGSFSILKKIHFRVHHALVGVRTAGSASRRAGLDCVRVIFSHQQALLQCKDFLKKHCGAARLVPVSSTARAMFLVAKSGRTDYAAIGAPAAAPAMKLNILANYIENKSKNGTTFLLIENVRHF